MPINSISMPVNNTADSAAEILSEKVKMRENRMFEMSPEEKALRAMEVDTLNKQNFGEKRIPKRELEKDDFLQLLIAQLTHQDPTSPMEDLNLSGKWLSFQLLSK